ncbi:protein SLX4IP [Sphaeramia orbicularis]|uniref:protein SLX4IP n=1 Tax=Sphaeramia orbicularis TaxID=375764 RepID=UPI001180CEF4|nr:protein SLX4IP [Sphaeramia orbicularis]
MAPSKFVIKCGNFAVLVDLHVLPLGGQEDASWFTTDHIEEVATLVRDSVEQRVKQYSEFLHNRRLPKQKKELAPASAFHVKGKNFSLVASFLKRHFSLKCIVKQHYGDLRVFPERYVVCVSCLEDASAHHGNPSLAVTELSEQSRSEYFSKVGETQEPLNSPAKTKKTVLQKIARQASVQQELGGLITGKQRDCPEDKRETESEKVNLNLSRTVSHGQNSPPETQPQVHYPSVLTGPVAQIANNHEQGLTQMLQNENTNSNEVSGVFCPYKISQETSKTKSDAGEDPYPQRAKRACLGRPPATTQPPSIPCSSQTSKRDLLPLPPLSPEEAKSESKAFPVSECKKTTLEVELLTPGKRAQRLPLTSNNTAQTNQNRLAASLRGLSVKPASSGSSISSRSTLREEGSENVPRTSRLRRLKRS